MKKLIPIILICTFFILSGCNKTTTEKEAIMVNGTIYFKSEKQIDVDTSTLQKISTITHITDANKLPKKDDQGNRKEFLNSNIFKHTETSVILEYNGYTLFTSKS